MSVLMQHVVHSGRVRVRAHVSAQTLIVAFAFRLQTQSVLECEVPTQRRHFLWHWACHPSCRANPGQLCDAAEDIVLPNQQMHGRLDAKTPMCAHGEGEAEEQPGGGAPLPLDRWG